MSFMFNPFPYEDGTPVNRPALSDATVSALVAGAQKAAAHLVEDIRRRGARKCVVALDGYISADWSPMVNLLTKQLALAGIPCTAIDVASCWKSQAELDELLADNLEEDLVKDPVLLFGKHVENPVYELLFDTAKLDALKQKLLAAEGVVIVHGAGCCCETLIGCHDRIVYLDVTPKQTILRLKNGRAKNLGDATARPFKALMRRSYYFDFELAMHLRKRLLEQDRIDYYLATDDPDHILLVPKTAFGEICRSLATRPFRCKPVYLEGVWGGYFIKRLRRLPDAMKNCAWVFDLIPLEVSLLIAVGSRLLEIPYFTFVCKEGEALMGKACVDAFGGYFPIRFNYDDSWHSSGNMSIQLHPVDEYVKEHNGEFGRQDESYYVVATGHGAKTYLGLKEGSDTDEFIAKVKQSERDASPVDYEAYVDHVESKPGLQVMLPAGTIHSSGRDQVVLEIGSLTVGSYTYKMYDYVRKDLDGKPRPIHTYHGERNLQRNRTTSWVRENLVQAPRLVRRGEDWAEYIVGEHDLLYFSLRRYEFLKKIEGDTNGVFHVLTLVDGEKVAVYAKDDPTRRYEPSFLDIIVVPANVGAYVIENLGDQPVCVHLTRLKENFEQCL